MAGNCPSISSDGEYLTSMLDYVDCQAQIIGENGYRALASPASSLSPLLTLAITIFIALIGYRFLVGDLPRPREAVLAAVKVGIVLMLATSWPSFQTLVYDVTMEGPAQLASAVTDPSGLPGSNGGLNNRLQGIDEGIAELMVRGTGAPNGPGAFFEQSPVASQWIPFEPVRNATMLAYARSTYLTATIGAYASVRLLAGLLLALGPIFALFLLFNGTRGLFEGWIRGLVGAALGATAISIILAVQVALMEPWLASILASRRAEVATPSVPVELFVASLVFALILIATLFAIFRLASGFRFPTVQPPVQWMDREVQRERVVFAINSNTENSPGQARTMQIVDAVNLNQRRESLVSQPVGSDSGRASLIAGAIGSRSAERSVPRKVQLEARRAQSRFSNRARKRDNG